MEEKLEVYTKGTKAWFKDKEEGYVVATMLSREITDKLVKFTFMIDATSEQVVFEQTHALLAKSNYDDLPPLKNPPRLEGSDDLTNLSYLHEAGVLNSVKIRYLQETIYTYSGLVLIAMNPFKRMNIYNDEIMKQYAGRPRNELEPHLFAIAEEAYRRMINESINQSIIVSGESGAGKTESAKYVMRYFAVIEALANNDVRRGSTTTSSEGPNTSVEEAVLSTNPIMEAFGNAKTTRNDNSSRFGKYIEILFDKKRSGSSVVISGARIRTYLLERSRLTFQPDTERNYHVFYQLCAAAPAAEKAQLGLDNWDTFNYLRQGKTGVVKGTNDVEEFAITQKGMSTVGISVSTQWDVFRLCAALLHIGNININDSRGKADIDDTDAALIKASELLGVEAATMKKWLIKKQLITRSEKIVTDANCLQAINSRDSVAKFIYSMLFDWIVKIVNVKLNPSSGSGKEQFIGVLDIYGFEHFQKNSFEQFCINFANEKLQQEFTRHVFRLEQEEYVAEKISWSFIDFNDNQPCIDMIEGKLGILDLLDEESRLPSGADKSLVVKLYQRFGTAEHKFFEKPRFGEVEFVVKHYALDVTYQIDGFIEKNRDTVSDEQLEMLNNSSFEFLKEVVKIEPVIEEKSPRPGPNRAAKKPTLGSIFKGSLISLMETLRQTNPHYIRCIKPNQSKVPFEFEPQNVLGQLIACGVLETIKISRAGYPSKQTYEEFVNRYYFLVSSNEWKTDPRVLTTKICAQKIKGANKYEMGLTKVFFRSGQLAYLEKIRSEKFTKIVILIQKNVIRGYHQKRYKKMLESAKMIQSSWNEYLKIREYRMNRNKLAATTIQKNWRASIVRKQFSKTKKAAIVLQSAYTGYATRRDADLIARSNAANLIASAYKMFKVTQESGKKLKDIIKVQSLFRGRKARRAYRKEKAELGGKLKEINYKLDAKVFELSQALDAKKKEVADLASKNKSLEEQLEQWKDRFSKADIENKSKGDSNQSETNELRKQLHQLVETKDTLLKEAEKLHGMIRKRDDQITLLQNDQAAKSEEMKSLKETLKSAPVKDDAQTEALKKEIVSLREQMSRLVAGKYRTERSTERFLSNDHIQSMGNQFPPIHTSAAARMSMSFFESAAQVTARVAETLGRGETAEQKPFRVRPMEVDESEPKERPIRMLGAPELQDEVIDSLITNLRIPLPSTQTVATRKEIFFPAHLLGYLLSELLQHSMVDTLRELLGHVMKAIHHLTMKFEDDYVSAFWLSNNYELMSVIKTARRNLPRPSQSNQDDESSAVAVLAGVNTDLKSVMVEIYQGWIREFKKRLSNMIVPAVIENQSLPGYVCNQSGGIWSQWAAKTSTTSQFSIDQLLNFLSKLSKTMRCYYMDESMSRQILTELIRVIGVNSFNHLLMRKNFCTWKRGVQIQYNVSRLEEWCNSHGIAEATIHLQQLLQASKLLTLNKSSESDIETIFDVCFLLNPTQIKKLLSLYYAADFDSPLSPNLLKSVSLRAKDDSDTLLLAMDDSPEFTFPEPREVEVIEKFIPAWVELPHIQAVLSAGLSTPSTPMK